MYLFGYPEFKKIIFLKKVMFWYNPMRNMQTLRQFSENIEKEY